MPDPGPDPDTAMEMEAESRRDHFFPVADEDVDFEDEWDDEDSTRYHDRVEAGLEGSSDD